MTRCSLALVSIALLAGCATRGAPPASSGGVGNQGAVLAPATISDSEIGLAPGTAFQQPTQHPVPENQVFPGDSTLKERPSPVFPPVVPHTLEGLDTITLNENTCLDCHGTAVAADSGAPPVPASHRTDMRRTPGVVGEQVVGARWVCTACHAAWTDTPALVPIR